jgi:hypothetical protein
MAAIIDIVEADNKILQIIATISLNIQMGSHRHFVPRVDAKDDINVMTTSRSPG